MQIIQFGEFDRHPRYCSAYAKGARPHNASSVYTYPMALRIGETRQLATRLNALLSGQRLSKAIQYDKDVFLFSTSKSGRLAFVLDNASPRVYLSDIPLEGNSLSTPFSMLLRKTMSNALIESVELLNDDRVLCFRLLTINDIYKEETAYLVAEIIPSKANLILLNQEKKVVGALRTNLITDPRPIFKGILYEPPLRKNLSDEEEVPFDFETYLAECETKEEALKERRKRTRFHDVFTHLSNKKKAANKKIKAIHGDIEEAKKHLEDGQYGNFIFTDLSSIHPEEGYMDYYGERIDLDPRKSASANAEAFFRRAKKAKATIARGEANLETAKKELEEAERLLGTLEAADEPMLEKLSKEYGLDGLTGKGKNASPLSEAASLPFLCIIDGTRYLFGKNAIQNDVLSFLLATKKNHLWLHVKDNHGAHLIIQKDNPSSKEIQLGCEICLLASKLESGEVMYTQHKNVRRGNVRGQAIVKEYQSAWLTHVSPEAKIAYENAGKWRGGEDK